jgi:3-O-methylgallate 3,4-dioxygenase
MATLVGIFNMTHSPFCYMPPEKWNDVRSSRSLRADVPVDDVAANRAKAARISLAFTALRARLAAAAPDVLVVFGDDQLESFDFTNFPTFGVYAGETFEGALSNGIAAKLSGHPALGLALLTGLMRRGFDPALCLDIPKPERNIGHAFFRPAESLTDLTTAIVPIFINCYYAPQPTAARCYEFGKALRKAIEEAPQDLRVAVVGSGGLWHTPGAKDAYLDEDFDRELLSYLESGDIKGMAAHFDNYHIPEGDTSQYIGVRARQATGMPGFGGPQGGTRETCNWIIAAAVADGTKNVIVDYVPVYASPIGAAWAYATDL